MKALGIINALSIGGAETLLRDLAPQLQRIGVAADILCLTTEQTPLARELAREGIQVFHSRWASPYSPLQALAIARHLSTTAYDVVHAHLYPAQLWTWIGARLAHVGTPLVTTEHSTWNRRRRRPFRPLDRWMYANYAAIACISVSAESALRSWLGKEDLPTTVIANGIHIERFAHASEARSRLDPDRQSMTVVCVGSLNARKGHEVLLRAVSQLHEIEAQIVGEGPLRSELERLAVELGVAERVRFLGARRDIPELLAAADVFVQPSLWEGFGIAALEAMAAGVPVVASDVPGLREVVGGAGLLFAAGAVEELRGCLAKLSGDVELRRRLAAQSRERARQYSIGATAAEYCSLYSSVLQGRKEANHRKAGGSAFCGQPQPLLRTRRLPVLRREQ